MPGWSQQRGKDQKPLFFVKISGPVTSLGGEGKAVAMKLSSGHWFGDSSMPSGQIRSKDIFGVMWVAAEVSVVGNGVFLFGINMIWEENGCKPGGLRSVFYHGIVASTGHSWDGMGRWSPQMQIRLGPAQPEWNCFLLLSFPSIIIIILIMILIMIIICKKLSSFFLSPPKNGLFLKESCFFFFSPFLISEDFSWCMFFSLLLPTTSILNSASQSSATYPGRRRVQRAFFL